MRLGAANDAMKPKQKMMDGITSVAENMGLIMEVIGVVSEVRAAINTIEADTLKAD